jgi:hypothetical protein
MIYFSEAASRFRIRLLEFPSYFPSTLAPCGISDPAKNSLPNLAEHQNSWQNSVLCIVFSVADLQYFINPFSTIPARSPNYIFLKFSVNSSRSIHINNTSSVFHKCFQLCIRNVIFLSCVAKLIIGFHIQCKIIDGRHGHFTFTCPLTIWFPGLLVK